MVVITLLFVFSNGFSQPNNEFVRRYVFNEGYVCDFYDVFQVLDGGYALTGRASSNFGDDEEQGVFGVWLLVLSSVGEVNWQTAFQPPDDHNTHSLGNSLIQTDDAGFVIGGYTSRNRSRRFTVMKSDDEGELVWWSEFGGEEPGECYAVIELKSDEILAGGELSRRGGYAVKIDVNGNAIWENIYEGMNIRSIRETDDGYLFAGSTALIKVAEGGEIIWRRNYNGGIRGLVSCIIGGYAICGQLTNENREIVAWMAKLNIDGNQIWERSYQINNRRYNSALSLVEMPEGGFALVGAEYDESSFIIRTDPAGNSQWIRYDTFGDEANSYYSVIQDQAGYIIAAGGGFYEDEGRFGILTKVVPQRSAPVITDFTPEELDFSVLLGDTVIFAVSAIDLQEDSLSFIFMLDGDSVATDTSATIIFEDLGDKTVTCTISDGDQTISMAWIVHVRQMYLEAFRPESTEITVRRSSEVCFGLEVAHIEDVNPSYTWTHIDRDQRSREIGDEDSIFVTFDMSGNQHIIGEVNEDENVHSINWTVHVLSAIWWWSPRENELLVLVDTTMLFEVFPFNEESDSLVYRWILDGNQIDSDSPSIEWEFHDPGQHQVTALVNDGAEGDTIIWTLEVVNPSEVSNSESAILPYKPTLLLPHPNPFNSSVTLSYDLPSRGQVKLSIYDLSGRLVTTLVNGIRNKGRSTIRWNADDTPAGVYLISFSSAGVRQYGKVVLIR